jgi:hypothetical protein
MNTIAKSSIRIKGINAGIDLVLSDPDPELHRELLQHIVQAYNFVRSPKK